MKGADEADAVTAVPREPALPRRGTTTERPQPPRHLYIHVPFCRARCDYCEFYSEPVACPVSEGEPRRRLAMFDRYLQALLMEFELERRAVGLRRLRSVYVGGGTPSLLGEERLERLLEALEPLLTPHAEVSVETNPEDVTPSYAAWAAGRKLRISLGVQSFTPRLRAALGRRSQADPAAAVAALRAAGVRNIGVDLIFGIPGQSAGDLEDDLVEVARLRPEHVSWYELSAPSATTLGRRISAGSLALPDEDAQAELYRHAVRGLERLGYRWYEVSNFALPGRRCRHNSAVWRGEPYLGLGPSAVSTLGGERRRNAPDLAAYLDALAPQGGRRYGRLSGGACPPPGTPAEGRPPVPAVPGGRPPVAPPREAERIEAEAAVRERLLLAARTGASVPLVATDAGLDLEALPSLVAAGFVAKRGGTLVVTRKGRYVANEICVRLFRDSSVKGASSRRSAEG